MVPRRAAAGGGGATAARRRGLPGAGDHSQPRQATRAQRVLGTAQTLHRTDYTRGYYCNSINYNYYKWRVRFSL